MKYTKSVAFTEDFTNVATLGPHKQYSIYNFKQQEVIQVIRENIYSL